MVPFSDDNLCMSLFFYGSSFCFGKLLSTCHRVFKHYRTEMRMLRWMTGMERIGIIRNEEIRARADAGVANISQNIREARLRWLGHVERKTEEDVVMGRWK